MVQTPLKTTGVDLSNGTGISEFVRFQEHFQVYKIVVYQCLRCEDLMFEGQVVSSKRINLLYDDFERHYHVIAKLTAATARNYMCKGCNKSCKNDVTHACDQSCSDCMGSPPCASSDVRTPCAECSRYFRSHTYFANHKQSTKQKRSVCERKRCCATYGWAGTHGSHECNKRFCENCKENKEIGHLCYMSPLKDVLSHASDKVLYVFYDFETTQNTEYTDGAKLHVPNLVCLQQFCSRCGDVEDGECVLCGRRKHSFWQVPVGDLLTYLTETRLWASKFVAIAHNAKAFDLHFILNKAILLKWKPEIIINWLKIMCMKVEHLVFLDSVSFLPCPLRKLPEAYGLSASKSW